MARMFDSGRFRKVLFPRTPLTVSSDLNDMGSPTTEFKSSPSSAKTPLQDKSESPSLKQQSILLSQKLHEIQGLKCRIRNLDEARADMEEEVNDIKKQNGQLRQTMETIRKENVSLRVELNEIKLSGPLSDSFNETVASPPESKIFSLQIQLKKAKAAEELAETKLFEAQSQLHDLEGKLSYNKAQVKSGLSGIKSLQSELDIMEKNYEEALKEIVKKSEAILEIENYSKELKLMLSDKQARVVDLESAVEEMTGELQQELLVYNTEKVRLRRENETLISKLAETEHSKQILEEGVSEAEERLALYSQLIESKTTAVEGLQTELQALRMNYEAALAEVSKKEETVLGLEINNKELDLLLCKKHAKILNLEAAVEKTTCEFEKAQLVAETEKTELKRANESLTNNLFEMEHEKEALEAQVKKCEEQVARSNQEIENKAKAVEGIQTELQGLRIIYEAALAEVSKKEETILGLEINNKELDLLLCNKHAKILDLEAAVEKTTCEFEKAQLVAETEKTELKRANEMLTSNLFKMEHEKKILEAQVKNSEEQVARSSQEIESKAKAVQGIQTELQSLRMNYETALVEVSKKEETVLSLEINNKDLNLQLSNKHMKILDLEAAVEKATCEFEKAQVVAETEKTEFQRANEMLTSNLFKMEHEKKILAAQVKKSEEQVDRSNQEIENKAKAVKGLQTELQSLRMTYETALLEVSKKEETVLGLEINNKDLNLQLSDKHSKILDLEAVVEKTSCEFEKAKLVAETEKTEFQRANETLTTNLFKMEREKKILEAQVKKSEEQVDQSNQEIENKAKAVQGLQTELQSLRMNYETALVEVSKKEETVLGLEINNKDLNLQLSNKHMKILDLEAAVEKTTCEFEKAQLVAETEKTELKRANEMLTSNLFEMEHEKKLLEAQVKNSEEQVARSSQEIESKAKAVQGLQTELQSLRMNYEAALVEVSKKEETVLGLEINNKDLNLLLCDKHSKILDLEAAVEKATCEFEKAQVVAETEKTEFQRANEMLTSTLFEMEREKKILEAQVKNCEDQVARSNQEIENKAKAVEGIQTELQGLRMNYEAALAELSKKEETVVSLESNNKDLNLQLSDKHSKILDLEAAVEKATCEFKKALLLAETEKTEFQRANEMLTSNLFEMEHEKKILEAQAKNSEEQVARSNQEIESKAKAVQGLQTELQSLRMNYEAALVEVSKKEETVLGLEINNKDLNLLLCDKHSKILDLEAAVEKATCEFEKTQVVAETEKTEFQRANEMLTSTLFEMEREKKILEAQVKNCEDQVARSNQEIETKAKTVEGIQTELQGLRMNYEAALAEVSKKEETVVSLESNNKDLNLQLSDKHSKILDLEAAVEKATCEFEKALLLAETEKTEFQRANEMLTSNLFEMEHEKKILEAQAKNSEEQVARSNQEIKSKAKTVELLQTEFQVLRHNKEVNLAEISKMAATIVRLELKCKELEDMKRIREVRIRECDDRLAVSIDEAQRQTKKECQEKYQEKFNNMKKQMRQVLEKEIKSGEDSIATENAKVTELSERVEHLLREKAQIRSGNLELIQKTFRLEEDGKKTMKLYTELQSKYDNLLRLQKKQEHAGQSTQHQRESSTSSQFLAPVSHSQFRPNFHSSTVSLGSNQRPFSNEDEFSISVDSLNSRRLSTASVASNGSTSSRSKAVPDGSGCYFTCADEEDTLFSNKNLASAVDIIDTNNTTEQITEIQRRNTLQPPHMRSVYPTYPLLDNANNDLNEHSIRAPIMHHKSLSGIVGNNPKNDNHVTHSGRAPMSPNHSNRGGQAPGSSTHKLKQNKSVDSVVTPQSSRQQELRDSGLFRHPFAR